VPFSAIDPRRIPEEIPAAAAIPQARPSEPHAVPQGSEPYVVQAGDTLARIAEERLGSPEKWRLLAEANGIGDPRALRVGQKLTIPPRSS
jgi:nucleoid-associated protein YgaU